MKKITKAISGIAMIVILALPMFVFAQTASPNVWGGANTQIEALGFKNNVNPQGTAVKVINLLLSFLGIIAVILVLWAGFLWMTAGGNEDKVATAKKIMISAVIGLLIILAAYGIVNWVLGQITSIV